MIHNSEQPSVGWLGFPRLLQRRKWPDFPQGRTGLEHEQGSSGAGRRGTKAQYVGLSPESRALWMDAAWVFWDYCRCLGDREACAQLRCCPLPFVKPLLLWGDSSVGVLSPHLHLSPPHTHTPTVTHWLGLEGGFSVVYRKRNLIYQEFFCK